MDYQVFFNIAIAVVGAAGGWILNRIYQALDRLDRDVRDMPHLYVSKEDYRRDIYDIKDKDVPGEEWWRNAQGVKTKLRGKWDYKYEKKLMIL